MVALGVILYLVARSLPRVGEETPTVKKNFFERWAASEIPEKVDYFINGFLEKFLRKSKVYLLRIDNFLTKRLNKTKTNGGNGAKQEVGIDFREIAGKINSKEETDKK